MVTCCIGRLHLKRDGTRAETRFHLSTKRTSPFKSAWASVQSTTGSRNVHNSGSNAGYTMFRGIVKGTVYPLHSPVSPFTSPSVRHLAPSNFKWTLSGLSNIQGTGYPSHMVWFKPPRKWQMHKVPVVNQHPMIHPSISMCAEYLAQFMQCC